MKKKKIEYIPWHEFQWYCRVLALVEENLLFLMGVLEKQ